MKIDYVVKGTKEHLLNIVDDVSKNDVIISMAKPFIKMVVDNNFYKAESFLKLAADKNGEIDINKLIDDSIVSVLNINKTTYPIGSVGSICFGNGAIQLNVFNKYFKFNSDDFIKYKNYLIENYK